MPKTLNLAGMIFGRLTAIRFLKSENAKRLWLCRCTCGKRIVVTSDRLRRGDTQSCGCLRKELAKKKGESKRLPIEGKRFGRLVVQSWDSDRQRWKCLCDCGNTSYCGASGLVDGRQKSCGCLKDEQRRRRGESHPNWRGGTITREGYRIYRAPDHPNADCWGKIREHVLVMSNFLGRPLRKGESVHHKNGVKDDNRIENLELWNSQHGSGQRVTDQIEWAKKLLVAYQTKKELVLWANSLQDDAPALTGT